MGRAAREKAASKFNLRQCATAYDESYRRLAGGTGSSRTGLAVPIASAFDALSLQSGTAMQGVAP
jgi:hypothetical protein